MPSAFSFPTEVSAVPVSEFPLIGAWGKQRISSKAGPHGVEQMYVDSYGRQHELGLNRETLAHGPGGHKFHWTLHFYTHPGLRRQIPVDIEHLDKTKAKSLVAFGELVDRLHSLAADPRAWMQFHGFGLHPGGFPTAKKALDYLRDHGSSWKYAKDRIPPEGFDPKLART
jgi:hypothetical protein